MTYHFEKGMIVRVGWPTEGAEKRRWHTVKAESADGRVVTLYCGQHVTSALLETPEAGVKVERPAMCKACETALAKENARLRAQLEAQS